MASSSRAASRFGSSWSVRLSRSLMLAVLAAHLVWAQEESELEEDDGAMDQSEGDEPAPLEGEELISSQQLRGVHKKIDSNTDGKVSMAEFMAFAQKVRVSVATKDIGSIAEELDVDKDGKLSLDELIKDMEQWGEDSEEEKNEKTTRMEGEKQKFKLADADGDGLLDSTEMAAMFYPEIHDGILEITTEQAIKMKDKNGDGMLSADEFFEMAERGDDMPIAEEEKSEFTRLDKNGDGMLDVKEMKSWESGHFHTEEALKKLIEMADGDKDEHLTVDELENAKHNIPGTDAQYHLMEWAEHEEL